MYLFKWANKAVAQFHLYTDEFSRPFRAQFMARGSQNLTIDDSKAMSGIQIFSKEVRHEISSHHDPCQ